MTTNKSAIKHSHVGFCEDTNFQSVGKVPSSELTDMVRLCSALYETTIPSSKMSLSFAFSPATVSVSHCSTSSPAFDISVLGFVQSNRCVLVPHCCFNLHFPNDIGC